MQLILLDRTTEQQRVYPPRNDTGVPVHWRLVRPREVLVEVVDGDTGTAFAWLGVARFSVSLEMFRHVDFLSSAAPGAERLTGVLRSREFAVPSRLRFLLAGHGSRPGKPKNQKKQSKKGSDGVWRSSEISARKKSSKLSKSIGFLQ